MTALLPPAPQPRLSGSMLLESPTPSGFLATHLAAHLARLESADHVTTSYGGWATGRDLVRDGAALLRSCHHSLVEDHGTPPPAAAKSLAGWFGGGLGEAIGFVFAAGAAGLLADHSVRWRHAGGRVDAVDISRCQIAVTAHHPWAGQPGTCVLENIDGVRDAVVAGLRSVLTPILQVLRSTAKVGFNSLWAEVADRIGMAFAFTPRLRQAPDTVRPLEYLLSAPAAPWRTKPLVWVAQACSGPIVVGRKGGCCLAYTAPEAASDSTNVDLDEYQRAYLEQFPRRSGMPSYCSTCSFRGLEDVEAQQRFWHEQRPGVADA